VSENVNSRPTRTSIFPSYKMAVCEKPLHEKPLHEKPLLSLLSPQSTCATRSAEVRLEVRLDPRRGHHL
jgi:hypothetical protein